MLKRPIPDSKHRQRLSHHLRWCARSEQRGCHPGEGADSVVRRPSLALAGCDDKPAVLVDVRLSRSRRGTTAFVVNPLPDGTTDIGCRYDEQTKLSAAGEYTFVIGTELQRAAIEQIPDVTFLPFSSAQPTALYVLLLRNMLVNSAFALPIQQVPQDANPASAAAVLGEYYPKAVNAL
jgi:hypothetical protein